MAKLPRSVLVLVHTSDAVLLLERLQPAGFWQSVTGSLEPGEDWEDAARRELEEETGFPAEGLVDTGVRNLFPILPPRRDRYPADVRDNEERVFTLALSKQHRPRLQPAEHRAFAWLTPLEAARRCSSATNRDAILRQFHRVLDVRSLAS
ncbi:dihydroneopterin triphosphate diphosphatase [Acidithiobacillus caldus]